MHLRAGRRHRARLVIGRPCASISTPAPLRKRATDAFGSGVIASSMGWNTSSVSEANGEAALRHQHPDRLPEWHSAGARRDRTATAKDRSASSPGWKSRSARPEMSRHARATISPHSTWCRSMTKWRTARWRCGASTMSIARRNCLGVRRRPCEAAGHTQHQGFPARHARHQGALCLIAPPPRPPRSAGTPRRRPSPGRARAGCSSARSVTEITPRASSRLKTWLALMHWS